MSRWNGFVLADRSSTDDTAPEIALWAAVLVQAIKDACLVGDNPRQLRSRDEARAWLLRGGQNFRLVCSGAGYDAERVRPVMERLAAAGWPNDMIKDGRGSNGFVTQD